MRTGNLEALLKRAVDGERISKDAIESACARDVADDLAEMIEAHIATMLTVDGKPIKGSIVGKIWGSLNGIFLSKYYATGGAFDG